MIWGLELYSLMESLLRGHAKVSKTCLINRERVNRKKKDKKKR